MRWPRSPPTSQGEHCCQNPDLKVITIGIEQWVSFDGDRLTATTDGHDDYGDADGPEHITCLSCHLTWRTPEDINWC